MKTLVIAICLLLANSASAGTQEKHRTLGHTIARIQDRSCVFASIVYCNV